MTDTLTMTIAEVMQLKSGDVLAYSNKEVAIADSGKYLEEYYKTTPRYNYRGGVKGKFWEKVYEVVDILQDSDAWPFEPIEVSCDGRLMDGHHRTHAAMIVGWDKPIPVEVW